MKSKSASKAIAGGDSRLRADVALVERGLFESRARAQAAFAARGVRAHIEAAPPHPWVSRGSVKLAAALDAFGFDPAGRGQLHADIASDPRVTTNEGTDAHSLAASDLPEPPQLISFDVSFVSLTLVLPAVFPLAARDARFIALIKPQFKAGPAHVVKGIVRDPAIHEEVCARIATLGQSPDLRVEGDDGNREFLIGASRQ